MGGKGGKGNGILAGGSCCELGYVGPHPPLTQSGYGQAGPDKGVAI